MRTCSKCGRTLDDTIEIFRSSTCPYCDGELKICLNCRFYKPGAHWECLETIPERVLEKDRSNYCEYFNFKQSGQVKVGSEDNDQARQKFDKLFGDAE